MTDHDVNAIADRVETAILARISRWLLVYALPTVIANAGLIAGIIWWIAVMDHRVTEHARVLEQRAAAVAELSVLKAQVQVNTHAMEQAMQDIRDALNRIEDRQYQDRRASNRREMQERQ